MKKLLTMIVMLAVFGLGGCAADVLVTTGAVAEGRKQEAEQAAETKKQILEGMEKNQKALEERRKQLEQQMEEQ